MSGTENPATEKRDVYARVTSQIVRLWEQAESPVISEFNSRRFKVALLFSKGGAFRLAIEWSWKSKVTGKEFTNRQMY
jgi:hypothetical protein